MSYPAALVIALDRALPAPQATVPPTCQSNLGGGDDPHMSRGLDTDKRPAPVEWPKSRVLSSSLSWQRKQTVYTLPHLTNSTQVLLNPCAARPPRWVCVFLRSHTLFAGTGVWGTRGQCTTRLRSTCYWISLPSLTCTTPANMNRVMGYVPHWQT